MSVASPTLLPRSALFPTLLPKPPQPHPLPLPRYGQQPARFNATRDLAREMEELSEEEVDLDDLTDDVKKRGFNWLIPIGRSFTQHEEKNDAEDQDDDEDDDDDTDDDDSDDSPSEGANNQTDADEEDDDEDEEQDLDADMADMDEPLNASLAETEGTALSDDMDAEGSGEFEIDDVRSPEP